MNGMTIMNRRYKKTTLRNMREERKKTYQEDKQYHLNKQPEENE